MSLLLREKAEFLLKLNPKKENLQLKKSDSKSLIHELQVHQIELEMQNEELVLAKTEAEVAREKYTELYDFAPAGYFTLSREGEIIELNLYGCQMLGKERINLIKRMFGVFVSDDTKPAFNNFLSKTYSQNSRVSCEVILSVNGNDPVVVQLTGIISDAGKHCLVTAVDITERKVAEVALAKSQLLLKSSLESQKETFILSIDCNFNYLYFNKTYADAVKRGYKKEIKIGMNVLDIFDSADEREVAKANYDRALKGESHSDIRKYGANNTAWFESFFNPIFNDNEEIVGATALARNITDRIESELELANSKKLYADLVANQSAGFYRIRVGEMVPGKSIMESATMEYMSDRFCELFEIDKNEFLTDPINLALSRIHPDDLPEFLKSNKESQLLAFNGEIRLLLNDRIKWVRYDSTPRKFEDESTLWTGMLVDITEQKMAQEEIRLNEERHRMLLEFASDAFFHGNKNGDIIAVNTAAIEQTAFSRDELLNMNLKDLFSKEVLLNLPLQYEQLENGETVITERDLLRKDRNIITVEMKSKMMPDGTFQSFFRDVTERKRIEKALKQKLSELEIYYELAITRERKMIALKSEINLLLERLGEEPKY